ncbi:pentapeptide repeat-containing protein [Paraburkholderia bryophila]|uniref:pentapeptide repeat-containing protein n=1 Tax=Paraburkholderia bryophila TaxID=420952 RepID=UPI0038B7EA88
MLIERSEYSDESSLAACLEGSIFRYCEFKDILLDGKSVDAVFLSCELYDVDWYWGFFNACLFVDAKFENCVFRGSNFADCRFLNCELIKCRFEEDNFGSPCSFEGTQWFGGNAEGCVGLPEYAFPKM